MDAEENIDVRFTELMDKLAQMSNLNTNLVETQLGLLFDEGSQHQLLIKLLLDNAQSLGDLKDWG